MSMWFYSSGAGSKGPIDTAELRRLAQAGEVGSATLVWTEEFGSDWRPLADVPLEGFQFPPPLPASAAASDGTTVTVGEFLGSEAFAAIVGPRTAYYKAKFSSMLGDEKAAMPTSIKKLRSSSLIAWNWPAALFTPGWLLYRRMYGYGIAVFAIYAATSFLPDTMSNIVTGAQIGLALVGGMYGNSFYLQKVMDDWATTRDSARIDPDTASKFGVSTPAPLVGYGAVIALVVAQVFGADILSAPPRCGATDSTDLVKQIVREQIAKDLYMRHVVDSSKSEISLKFIRTQAEDTRISRCAADLEVQVSMKDASQQSSIAQQSLSTALTKSITYTVEMTETSGEIYATIYGF